MYALRAEDVNWWEEDYYGVQEVRSVVTGASAVVLDVLWRGRHPGKETYRERRRIGCERQGRGFIWSWETRRESLRGHRLVQSGWTVPKADGRRINYHGLGIRLPWAWSFPGEWYAGIRVEGVALSADDACGLRGPEVTFWGLIDGHLKPPMAAVTMGQSHAYAWFVLRGDFAYLSAGITGEGPVDVDRGQLIEERYQVVVEDVDTAGA